MYVGRTRTCFFTCSGFKHVATFMCYVDTLQTTTQKAQSIISRVKCPSETTVLGSLFPATRKRHESFDPTAECIQKKKKAVIRCHNKPSNITVVLLKEFSSIVPKGKRRKVLASRGRMKQVRFLRLMSPLEVKNAILRIFKDLNVTSFIVLDMAESGRTLVQAENQNIDGESAVNRRGCLYLCEMFEVR